MTEPPPREVTQLLIDWSGGDQAAFDELVPLVNEELRRLAHRYMGREHAGHTLQTSALVNEANLRLVVKQGCAGKPCLAARRGLSVASASHCPYS